ncbi:MAG: class I SAM-dependent methyltransferase [Actinomycetota bacterium]
MTDPVGGDPVAERLRSTAAAFDSVAATYDGPQGNNDLIQRMRAIVWSRIDALVSPGSRLLDLGCGTGLDAERFARAGHHVLATDWSPAMVERASARSAAAGDRIEACRVGAHELDRLVDRAGTIDLAYSNFGPLNCVPDLGATARSLSALVRPGGYAVFTVIGRWCPWEIVHYARRRRWRRVSVRFARGVTPVSMNGRTIWTSYYTPRQFLASWTGGHGSPWSVVSRESLSLFVPPPYIAEVADRRPRLFERLERADEMTCRLPLFRDLGDHFLVVLRRS